MCVTTGQLGTDLETQCTALETHAPDAHIHHFVHHPTLDFVISILDQF